MKYEKFADDYREVIAFSEARIILIEYCCRREEDMPTSSWFWDVKKFTCHVIHLAREAGIEC